MSVHAVKVCGVRRVEDARRARELGASYVGCVLAPDSPRCATLAEAKALAAAVGPRRLVLVFRNPTTEHVADACAATGTTHVQVHDTMPGFIEILRSHHRLNPWRVFAVRDRRDGLPEIEPPASVFSPAVLDTGRGGTGRLFGWDLLADGAPYATFVAGGITPENVGDLLRLRPWGIDVSSGIESAPGVKNHARMEALFAKLEVLA